MAAQRPEGLLGTVTGGGEPVRAQAHPSEERDQRELVKETLIGNILGLANERRLQLAAQSGIAHTTSRDDTGGAGCNRRV